MVWPLILCFAVLAVGDETADQRHLRLAEGYHRSGRFEEARNEALAANRIRASYDSSLLLARIALDSRQLNEAIEWLSRAGAAKPEEPEVYRLLGMTYALGGAKKESAAAFFQAIRLAPKSWEYHYLAGRVLYDLERFPDAKREFELAIELNAVSVRAWTALGQLQERTQNPAEAEQSYRKAAALCGRGSECAWPMLELGRVLETRSEKEAERYYADAVAARPDWAKPHYYLGKALAAREQYQAARRELESAVKLDGSRPEYFYQLGQVCSQLGDEETARRYLARFREVQAEEKKTVPMQLEQP